MQLFVAEEDLERPQALLEPAPLGLDRPYSPQRCRYSSPDTLAWSPDDRQIAFPRLEWFTFEDGERLPGTGLWARDTYTGRVSPLATHPPKYRDLFYYDHTPQWSPDGRYLAFVGEGINGQRALFVRSLAAQAAHKVSPRFDRHEDSDWPAWEPSTRKGCAPTLVFRQGLLNPLHGPPVETLRCIQPGSPDASATGEIWRLRARDYAPRLPKPPHPGEAIAPRAGQFAWSPDGQQIAFALTPDARDYHRYELWVVRRDGSAARRVSPADGRGYLAPTWIGTNRLGALSPRGDQFAVIVLEIETGRARTLGSLPTSDCDWSPDRRWIVYATPPASALPTPRPRTTLRRFRTGL
jgi:dipeptidyl aminopeptidase/acylaminoacyl peptidase